MVPAAVGRYEAMVAELPGLLARAPDRARYILRRLLGEVPLARTSGDLYVELATNPERLMTLAGITPKDTGIAGKCEVPRLSNRLESQH